MKIEDDYRLEKSEGQRGDEPAGNPLLRKIWFAESAQHVWWSRTSDSE